MVDEKRRSGSERLRMLLASILQNARGQTRETKSLKIKLDVDTSHYNEEYEARPKPGEMPFYGMLDEEEQEYFKRADTMLELNQFPNLEERELFLANVYAEANGKELKIANSQSCSRLMERLILMSSSGQLKAYSKNSAGSKHVQAPVFRRSRYLQSLGSCILYNIGSPLTAARHYLRRLHQLSLRS